MDADFFRMLLAYNAWANARVLEAASALEIAELSAAAGLSHDSILGTLAHVLGTEAVWLARWKGESPSTILPIALRAHVIDASGFETFEALGMAWEAHNIGLDTFVAAMDDEAVDAIVEYQNSTGRAFANALGHLIAHVVNHGTQFRGEAAVSLTRLGHSPGDLDLIAYIRGSDVD